MEFDTTMQEARKEAAMVLQAGQKLAARAAQRSLIGRERARLCVGVLGGLLTKPSEFWAGAAVIQADSEVTGVDEIGLSIRYAAARMVVGDFDFIRESLVGQAQWCSVLAVKLAVQAEGEDKVEKLAPLLKLAMQAQRQAAQALATAAALNKLVDADAVTVGC